MSPEKVWLSPWAAGSLLVGPGQSWQSTGHGVSWGSGALQSAGLQQEAAGSLSPGRGRRISEGTSPHPRRSSLHLDPFNAGSSRNPLPSLHPSGALY